MNKGLKISLLVLAVFLVVGATVVFVKTILDPPTRMSGTNAFAAHVQHEASLLDGNVTDAYRDSVFHLVLSELSIQTRDEYIDGDTRERLIRGFMTKYTPSFNERCQRFFSGRWTLDGYYPMSRLFSEVKYSISTISNPPAELTRTVSDLGVSFDLVNNARTISHTSKFRSEQSASSAISTALNYRNQYPVNNCSQLVTRLSKVPANIESNHFHQITSVVSKLERYSKYSSMQGFMSDYEKLGTLVQSYYNMAGSYGSHYRSLESYLNRASSAYSSAYYYFYY